MCLYPQKRKSGVYPCGVCIECRTHKADIWAVRCMLEASLYDRNCMVTLTYAQEFLPLDNSVYKEEIQKFLKRLRRKVGDVRYFGCGEYGDLRGRPHYHLIIFGWFPDDAYFFCKDRKGTNLYRSSTLEKLWPFGLSSLGEVTLDSARYCSLYLQPLPEDGREPGFRVMSTHPGIGFGAVFSSWLESNKLYSSGKMVSMPYYIHRKLLQPLQGTEEEKRLLSLRRSLQVLDPSPVTPERDLKLSRDFGNDYYQLRPSRYINEKLYEISEKIYKDFLRNT